MKNSKREITLNERDSIKDMLCMEKLLLREYCTALFSSRRKETRNFLSAALPSAAEEVYFLEDLLDNLSEKHIKSENSD